MQQQQKPLMEVTSIQLSNLHEQYSETGMDFQIADTPSGLVVILEDGAALPCYPDQTYYDLADLLAGRAIPDQRRAEKLTVSRVFRNTARALNALRKLKISSRYTGSAGAFPLVAYDTLKADTVLYRCLSSTKDHRYAGGQLRARTYLTTSLDQSYANSGFAVVGRYALPIPLPTSNVIKYELKKGTHINVGTVAPLFGQAGGGVEILLPVATAAIQVGTFPLPDY